MLLEWRGFTATGVSFWAVVSRLTSTTKLDGVLAAAAKLGRSGAVPTGDSGTQAATPSQAAQWARWYRLVRMGDDTSRRGTSGNMPATSGDGQGTTTQAYDH